MTGGRRPSGRSIVVDCLIDIEETADSLHAHAVLQDIEIRPGDVVILHDAPTGIAFGDRISCECRATVRRASWLERLWVRTTALFEITELYEIGFSAGGTK
jgi:hypothetical protein